MPPALTPPLKRVNSKRADWSSPRTSDDDKKAQPSQAQPSQAQPSQAQPSQAGEEQEPQHPVLAALEKEGLGVVLLEEVTASPEALTKEKFLALDHLLLPKAAARRALELCNQMVAMKSLWLADETDVFTDIWEAYLQPQATKAAESVQQGNFAAALGEVLGVVLFTSTQDNWLRKQEVHQEWDTFCRFFQDLAAGCKAMTQMDLEERYKDRLQVLFKEWQDRVNEALGEEEWAAGKGLSVSLV